MAAPVGAQSMHTYQASRGLRGPQPPLRVTLDFGAGRMSLRAADEGTLYSMRVNYDSDRYSPVQRYDSRTGILHLGLSSIGRAGIRVVSRQQLEQVGRFELAGDVPLLLEANLGASEARLELGGLHLVELSVRTGATRGNVSFDQPTIGECRSAAFTLGATELMVVGLGNSSCARMVVDGGMGRATLDFDGEWRGDTHLEVSLAVGSLTLRVPRSIGLRLTANERFLSRIHVTDMVREGATWQSAGYDAAEHHLVVDFSTNVAELSVEWIDP